MSTMEETLFEQITSFENIEGAFRIALLGHTKYTKQAIMFHNDSTYNIMELRNSLITKTYKFSGYTRFTVYEPKERLIDAPYFIDKVVQLAINNVIKYQINKSLITDTYACIDNRGTHKCSNKIQKNIKRAQFEYGDEASIIKIDIKKFFYSIDRNILKEILRRKFKCKDTLELMYTIIDSADSISEIGLPLGNTLSQTFANIYMNGVDQYAKRELGLKYYVRYADDIVIICRNKDYAKNVLDKLVEYMQTKLNLTVNSSKTKIFPIAQGVNAIGFKTHATHKLLRDTSKRHIKKRLRDIPTLISEKRISINQAEQILNSWKGHADNANSHNFLLSIINRYPYIYLDSYNKIRIKERWFI